MSDWFVLTVLAFAFLVLMWVVPALVSGSYSRKHCRRPRRGYYCTWAKGHLGECDEWPEWWMELWLMLRGKETR